MLSTREFAKKHDALVLTDFNDCSMNVQLTPEDEPLLMQDKEDDEDKQKKTEMAKKLAIASAPATKVLFLDGIRGLAAMLVISKHTGEYMDDIDFGKIAVDVFFVLSSFLLTWIFMKKSFRMLNQGAGIRTWVFALADYFSRRFFRVYPLFATICVTLWFMDDEVKLRYFLITKPETYSLFKTLTFDVQSRYFVFWTLPLEIAYYFIIPVFVLGTLLLRKFWWVPFIPAYFWVVIEGCNEMRTDHQEMRIHLPTFVAGSMAAVLYFKLDTWIKANNFYYRFIHKLILRTIEYLALAVFLSLAFVGLFFIWVHENPVKQTEGAPFVSVLMTIVLVCEMLLPSPLSLMLEWSFLRYWGKISFSAYLLQGLVIYNGRVTSQPNYYCRLFSRYGLICMLATASYHLIEHPSQLLAQRITKALNEQEAKGSGGLTVLLGKWANPLRVLADGWIAVQKARASGECI
ncbi:unnamed protein product [Peronospora farinosa]|uniref:Acyltransferase 3 domain-containing protein n=1 Tax=Peronospora farinosa TaxID=134698 RepID=A0AAV0SNG4_9STRA|nr:unnamed protein product [Peronospora farinosa]CAI5704209.1 unnamed protein product [Peronospora farinosa]